MLIGKSKDRVYGKMKYKHIEINLKAIRQTEMKVKQTEIVKW